jgi:hypothetical protein
LPSCFCVTSGRSWAQSEQYAVAFGAPVIYERHDLIGSSSSNSGIAQRAILCGCIFEETGHVRNHSQLSRQTRHRLLADRVEGPRALAIVARQALRVVQASGSRIAYAPVDLPDGPGCAMSAHGGVWASSSASMHQARRSRGSAS